MLGLSFFEILSLSVGVSASALVFFQLRQSSVAAKANIILSINRDLQQFSPLAAKLDNEQLTDPTAEELEELLDYISYFEGLFVIFKKGIISRWELDVFFGGRFLRLFENSFVKTQILFNHQKFGPIFVPIYKLHWTLLNSRVRSTRLRAKSAIDQISLSDREFYKKMIKS